MHSIFTFLIYYLNFENEDLFVLLNDIDSAQRNWTFYAERINETILK